MYVFFNSYEIRLFNCQGDHFLNVECYPCFKVLLFIAIYLWYEQNKLLHSHVFWNKKSLNELPSILYSIAISRFLKPHILNITKYKIIEWSWKFYRQISLKITKYRVFGSLKKIFYCTILLKIKDYSSSKCNLNFFHR